MFSEKLNFIPFCFFLIKALLLLLSWPTCTFPAQPPAPPNNWTDRAGISPSSLFQFLVLRSRLRCFALFYPTGRVTRTTSVSPWLARSFRGFGIFLVVSPHPATVLGGVVWLNPSQLCHFCDSNILLEIGYPDIWQNLVGFGGLVRWQLFLPRDRRRVRCRSVNKKTKTKIKKNTNEFFNLRLNLKKQKFPW